MAGLTVTLSGKIWVTREIPQAHVCLCVWICVRALAVNSVVVISRVALVFSLRATAYLAKPTERKVRKAKWGFFFRRNTFYKISGYFTAPFLTRGFLKYVSKTNINIAESFFSFLNQIFVFKFGGIIYQKSLYKIQFS